MAHMCSTAPSTVSFLSTSLGRNCNTAVSVFGPKQLLWPAWGRPGWCCSCAQTVVTAVCLSLSRPACGRSVFGPRMLLTTCPRQLSLCMSAQELAAEAAAEPRAACKVVSRVLDSLGLEHQCHVLLADGFLLADILLPESRAALLLEGADCYVRNTGQGRGGLQAYCARSGTPRSG